MRILTSDTALAATYGGVLVPTMGALHEGHAALVRRGSQLARERGLSAGCVVSIFVNPTQFNQKSDYDRYPRTLEEDAELCAAAGATIVFAPTAQAIYPPPPAPPIRVPPLPEVAVTPGLEDRFRPGHFAGVCQVVNRLFELVRPAAAVFGEKDWQQLQVVTAMTQRLTTMVEIVAHPTLRGADGLALSSRNRFLSETDRTTALAIPSSLRLASGILDPWHAEVAMKERLTRAGLRVEYAAVRDASTLGPLASASGNGRALIAAWAGGVRLIDNAAWLRRP